MEVNLELRRLHDRDGFGSTLQLGHISPARQGICSLTARVLFQKELVRSVVSSIQAQRLKLELNCPLFDPNWANSWQGQQKQHL